MTRATRPRRLTRSSRASLWIRRSEPRSRPISPTWRYTRRCWRTREFAVSWCAATSASRTTTTIGTCCANLLQLLVDGTVRPHEPAFDPEPDAYVTWDYCRGYADASLNEATSESDGYR